MVVPVPVFTIAGTWNSLAMFDIWLVGVPISVIMAEAFGIILIKWDESCLATSTEPGVKFRRSSMRLRIKTLPAPMPLVAIFPRFSIMTGYLLRLDVMLKAVSPACSDILKGLD
ncbi:hypothetical protein BMS3Abin06_01906 [bacterium BMS3Abin06]|nr:hypothetical protein BMS3Abin06_01906 [bacterium BMS3Abin06]